MSKCYHLTLAMACTAASHASHSWRARRSSSRCPPLAAESILCGSPLPAGQSKPNSFSAQPELVEEALVINLERRSDRLVSMARLPWGIPLTRLAAVEGSALSWHQLQADGHVHTDAVLEGIWAEKESLPTICRSTGSFSPHLTLSAVGCALSHRLAWQRLLAETSRDFVLILEDDVDALCDEFDTKLGQVTQVATSAASENTCIVLAACRALFSLCCCSQAVVDLALCSCSLVCHTDGRFVSSDIMNQPANCFDRVPHLHFEKYQQHP